MNALQRQMILQQAQMMEGGARVLRALLDGEEGRLVAPASDHPGDEGERASRAAIFRAAMSSLERVQAEVPLGSCWDHRKGGTYEIRGHALLEADYSVLVAYGKPEEAPTWCRPASEFLDGRFTRLHHRPGEGSHARALLRSPPMHHFLDAVLHGVGVSRTTEDGKTTRIDPLRFFRATPDEIVKDMDRRAEEKSARDSDNSGDSH